MTTIGAFAIDLPRLWAGGPEQPVPRERCAAVACKDDRDRHGSFDVYCTGSESHLLALGDRPRLQTLVVYGFRGVFGALALAAATWNSTIPLQVVSALIGLLLLGLPLRRFPIARTTGVVCWSGLVTLLAVAHDTSAGRSIDHGLIAGGSAVLLAGVVAFVATGGGGRLNDLAERSIGAALGAAVACAMLALVFGTIGGLGRIGHVLLLFALVAATAAGGGAAVAGFIRGARRVSYSFSRPDPWTPRPIKGPRPRDLVRRRGFAQSFLFLSQRVAMRLTTHSVRIANFLVGIVFRVLNIVRREVKRIASFFSYTARLLASAAREWLQTLVRSATATSNVAIRWGYSRALPILLLAGAAVAANEASSHFVAYLDRGSVADGALSVLLSAVAVCALVTAWLPLTDQSVKTFVQGVQRLAENGGPPLFITLLALGWAEGILGLVGIGPMRPGWLTIAGTVILLGSLAYAWWSNQAGETVGTDARVERDLPAAAAQPE